MAPQCGTFHCPVPGHCVFGFRGTARRQSVPVLLVHDTSSSPFQVWMTLMGVLHGSSHAGDTPAVSVRCDWKLGRKGDFIFSLNLFFLSVVPMESSSQYDFKVLIVDGKAA